MPTFDNPRLTILPREKLASHLHHDKNPVFKRLWHISPLRGLCGATPLLCLKSKNFALNSILIWPANITVDESFIAMEQGNYGVRFLDARRVAHHGVDHATCDGISLGHKPLIDLGHRFSSATKCRKNLSPVSSSNTSNMLDICAQQDWGR